VALDPANATAHRTLGHILSQQGRHRDAEAELSRARDLDPLEGMHHALSAQVAFQARDYRTALEHARQAIRVDSGLWIGYVQLAQAYERLGEDDRALEALVDASRLSNGNSKTTSLRGYILAKTGRLGQAHEVLKRLRAVARERYVPPYAMALVHAGLGEREAMFDSLEDAYAERDVHLIFLPADPKWDAFRGAPRFGALLTRCAFMAPRSPPVSAGPADN
jgi:tetratricopeptide (TPR) repeat protein